MVKPIENSKQYVRRKKSRWWESKNQKWKNHWLFWPFLARRSLLRNMWVLKISTERLSVLTSRDLSKVRNRSSTIIMIWQRILFLSISTKSRARTIVYTWVMIPKWNYSLLDLWILWESIREEIVLDRRMWVRVLLSSSWPKEGL